jgi:hypothetical protein
VLRPLCEAVQDVLWLTREMFAHAPETAREGNFHLVFQRMLDSDATHYAAI